VTARLAGLANPLNHCPAFLVPLFVVTGQGNSLHVQKISPSDQIVGFEAVDIGEVALVHTALPETQVNEGDSAVWAFAFGTSDIVVGDSSSVGEKIRVALIRGDFHAWSFLEAEAASFCGEEEMRRDALRQCFASLRRQSKLGSAIWRDIVILLPAVLEDLADILPPSENAEDIDVEVERQILHVTLSRAACDKVSSSHPTFDRTLLVAAAFGISAVACAPRKSRQKPPANRAEANLGIYGILEAVGSTRNFIRRGGAAGKQLLVLPYGLRDFSLDAENAPKPYVEFTIARGSPEMLQNACQAAARKLSPARIRACIVIQRAGFGSPRSDTFTPTRLDTEEIGGRVPNLRSVFNCLFYVGGHTLSFPTNDAPSLTALARGTSLATSCAAAIVALAASLDPQKLEKELTQSSAPGAVHVATRVMQRKNPIIETWKRAYWSMLHPELLLDRAQKFYLLAPRRTEIPEARIRRSLAVESGYSLDKFEWVELTEDSPQTHVACVALGVPVSQPTTGTFSRFCCCLLKMLGWNVEPVFDSEALTGIIGRYDKRRIGFMTLVSPVSINLKDEASFFSFARVMKGMDEFCCITNFTPTAAAKAVALSADMHIFHYSRLEQWRTGFDPNQRGPYSQRKYRPDG